MTYATLMVNLEFGQSNASLLQTAGDLAERFHSGVIGVAACQPMNYDYGGVYISGELVEEDRKEIDREMKKTEAEFRDALQKRAKFLEWRSTVTAFALCEDIIRTARGADLIITNVNSAKWLGASQRVNTADLVMRAGRPVFLVPPAASKPKLDRVLVAWKDTREARRAVLDALPLLKKAAHITIVEIAGEDDAAVARTHLEDVVLWLKRHGAAAESFVSVSNGNDATRLNAIAQEKESDVIVAGAYGHSRMREWALGGVTMDLLLCASRCAFVSH